jgi:hypothetical protein
MTMIAEVLDSLKTCTNDPSDDAYYRVMASYNAQIRTIANGETLTRYWDLYMEMLTFFWHHHTIFIKNPEYTKIVHNWVDDMVLLSDRIPQSYRSSFLDLAVHILRHPTIMYCAGIRIY